MPAAARRDAWCRWRNWRRSAGGGIAGGWRPDWQPRPRDAAQALLESTGFTGPFWSLTG